MRARHLHHSRRHPTQQPLRPELRQWLYGHERAPVTRDRLLGLLTALRGHRSRYPGDDDFVITCAQRLVIAYFIDQDDQALADLLDTALQRPRWG
jgi:hypothetical protein